MKTKTAYSAQRSKNVMTRFISAAFLAATFLISNSAISKNVVPGIRFGNYVTGSQLGSCFSPSFVLSYGKWNVAAGPNIQLKKFNVSGIKSSVAYDFGNADGKVSIFLFESFLYQKSAYLGKGCVKTQNTISHETSFPFETMKVSTVELYGGFGIHIKHNNYISSSWGIGFGMYNTIGGHKESMSLYREKSAAALMLKCAFTLNFVKQK